MTNNKIQAYAERLMRHLDERDAINGDIKDIYAEVKAAQFDPIALRAIIAEQRKPPDASLEATKEAYRAALGAPGATYRSVAEQTGISKSKLQRLVPREENGTPNGEADVANNASVGGGGVLAPAAAPPANPAAVVTKATTRAAALLGLDGDLTIPEHLRRQA